MSLPKKSFPRFRESVVKIFRYYLQRKAVWRGFTEPWHFFELLFMITDILQISQERRTHSRICSRRRCRSCRRRCTARCSSRRPRRRRGASSGPCGTACSCSLRRWAGRGTGTTCTGTRTRSGRPSRTPAGCWPTSGKGEGKKKKREVKKRRRRH